MVSVVPIRAQDALAERPQGALIQRALAFARPLYEGQTLSTGEPVWPHALGLAASLASIGVDPAAQAAGVLFAVPKLLDDPERLKAEFGEEIAGLAAGVEKLYKLRVLTRASAGEQNEILRKMVLGMVEDIRVVLIRLASRTQTLRWFAKNPSEERKAYARESLDIYSPLANRLGVWQLKWELEDLSFRYLEPELYKKIAQMLDQKRVERELYIENSILLLKKELQELQLNAQVTGRPKHIYSIWNKMRLKQLDFSDVHDVRALRVIVPTAGDCYSVLGAVHDLWEPIPKEFDDYISRPKGNNYQSLHTAVIGPGGRTLEVQIRTEEMHRQAEFGVAAHWRYKESGKTAKAHAPARTEVAFDGKIAWLRELLAWRDEVADGAGSAGWAEKTRKASLDDTIYVLTPQGKVIDLPAGATPVDFAYTLHTDLGHRCRGARVDGQLVKLDHPLASGQRVEIIAAKAGGPHGVGPSRDWLQPELGFLKSHRARGKVRQWFNARQVAETVAQGRAIVEKEQRREGATQANLEQLAHKLAFAKPEELFAAVARDEVSLRQLQAALRELGGLVPAIPVAKQPKKVKAKSTSRSGILVVGVDRLMTQLAKCCKPVPPDPVRGFVTRGKGISVHRDDCAGLKRLAERSPERLIEAQWGKKAGEPGDATYPVDVLVTSADRQGLLRDIGETLARERINVTAVRTQSRDELAHMRFSFEVSDAGHLKRALAAMKQVKGVIRVGRA